MIELTGYKEKHEYINKNGVRSVVYLMDNMDAMAQMSTNQFDLACVDPPYGIDWMAQVENPNKGKNWKQYESKDWDSTTPTKEYFEQLFRVSKNQIIWGGNYMIDHLYSTPCLLIWDKMQEFSGAVFETAWTSFHSPSKAFRMSRASAYCNQNKIHPTQKPVALYDWTFKNYAKPDDTILDTHLGSGSSRIAADKHNLPFTGIKLDPDYFRDHCKRFDNYTSQLTLF